MKFRKVLKYSFTVLAFLGLLITVSACGCNDPKPTYTDIENNLKEQQISQIAAGIKVFIDTNKIASLPDETRAQINNKTNTLSDDSKSNPNTLTNPLLVLQEAYNQLALAYPDYLSEYTVEKIMADTMSTLKSSAVDTINKYREDYDLDNYHTILTEEIHEKYKIALEIDSKQFIKVGVTEEKVTESDDLYQILRNYTLEFDVKAVEQEGLRWYTVKGDNIFNFLFNNILVVPIAWLMQFLSFGGYYIFGLVLVTIIIRTIMWPVYAKTNDMSLKMGLMNPELAALQKKYEGRSDPMSERQKQMEQMQLYKKYGIGLSGCLMPFLQFPIFMAIFRAVSKMPLTDGRANTLDWGGKLKGKVFGVDLFTGFEKMWSAQFWAIMVILVIVVGTQLLQQFLTTRRQKQMKEKNQENVPVYRRQATEQGPGQGTMKFMMYFMTFMMAVFVIQSPAGLGTYWCVGNIYSICQMFINNSLSDKRKDKLEKKYGVR